ncbi:hypothetical protein [Rhodoferax sp.]|uniref:hypothetical protein n=1 Tax=Rhodoferax sp. TaxID=50421 RepID=UPI002ACDA357|nr:hypothetical protein [Rhodoferax sp.]MDZ7919381.1 hypothetical protein [Rhodoferax sp.]
MRVDVALVAEDVLSLAVMRKVIEHTGRDYQIVRTLNEKGVGNIRKALDKYRNASYALAHVVLVDLDDAECPPLLREQWGVVNLPDAMLFRVAVREIESWVLADRDGFSAFFGVAVNKITQDPESLQDPKQSLINIVRKGRNRKLITEIVPAQGVPMSKGPLYNERLTEFVTDVWDVDKAISSAPSLRRTFERLQIFLQ